MEINAFVEQLPNFAGLVLCIMYLWASSRKKDELIERLIEVLVSRENCDDEDGDKKTR